MNPLLRIFAEGRAEAARDYLLAFVAWAIGMAFVFGLPAAYWVALS